MGAAICVYNMHMYMYMCMSTYEAGPGVCDATRKQTRSYTDTV
jgi:hypothetical protein